MHSLLLGLDATLGLRAAATSRVNSKRFPSLPAPRSREWLSPFCALQAAQTASMRGGARVALRLAQARIGEQRLDEFQVEMAGTSGMHLMSLSNKVAGWSAQDIRDCVWQYLEALCFIFFCRH